jgi:hypothetical protein
MDPGIFYKTTLDTRVMPQLVAAPEARQERDGPSTIKLYRDPSAEQLAAPAPLSEVIYVADQIVASLVEVLGQVQDDAATETSGLKRENERLAGELAELKGQVGTLIELVKREAPPPLAIKGWRVDAENACATPQMSDGSNGAALPLLALFSELAQRFAEAERPAKRSRAARDGNP